MFVSLATLKYTSVPLLKNERQSQHSPKPSPLEEWVYEIVLQNFRERQLEIEDVFKISIL